MARQQFSANVNIEYGYSILGAASVYATLTVGTTAVEAKAGATKAVGRAIVTLMAHPDNTGRIAVGLDNTVAMDKAAYWLDPGQAVSIELKQYGDPSIWVVANVAGQKVGVIEGVY